MEKLESLLEHTLAVFEHKKGILKAFFSMYKEEQKHRKAHYSDSENFAQDLFEQKRQQDEIFLKALERNCRQLEKKFSEEKVWQIVKWLKEEGLLEQEKEEDISNFLCRQPQKGENFVAQQIARDIEKEFLFKQAQLDLKKYEQVHSAVLKIKNMYEKSVEKSQKN